MNDLTNPLIKAEEAIEALAMVVARYYRTLIENQVPDELARQLTLQYQLQQLQQAAGAQLLKKMTEKKDS